MQCLMKSLAFLLSLASLQWTIEMAAGQDTPFSQILEAINYFMGEINVEPPMPCPEFDTTLTSFESSLPMMVMGLSPEEYDQVMSRYSLVESRYTELCGERTRQAGELQVTAPQLLEMMDSILQENGTDAPSCSFILPYISDLANFISSINSTPEEMDQLNSKFLLVQELANRLCGSQTGQTSITIPTDPSELLNYLNSLLNVESVGATCSDLASILYLVNMQINDLERTVSSEVMEQLRNTTSRVNDIIVNKCGHRNLQMSEMSASDLLELMKDAMKSPAEEANCPEVLFSIKVINSRIKELESTISKEIYNELINNYQLVADPYLKMCENAGLPQVDELIHWMESFLEHSQDINAPCMELFAYCERIQEMINQIKGNINATMSIKLASLYIKVEDWFKRPCEYLAKSTTPSLMLQVMDNILKTTYGNAKVCTEMAIIMTEFYSRMRKMNATTLPLFESFANKSKLLEEKKHRLCFNYRHFTARDAKEELQMNNFNPVLLSQFLDKDLGLSDNALYELLVDLVSSNTELAVLKDVSASLFQRHGDIDLIKQENVTFLGSLFVNLVPVQTIEKLSDDLFKYLLALVNDASPIDEKMRADNLNHMASFQSLLLEDPLRLKAICARTFRLQEEDRANASLYLLLCAPASVCQQLNASKVLSSFDSLVQLPWGCGEASVSGVGDIEIVEAIRQQLPTAAICGRYIAQKALLPDSSSGQAPSTLDNIQRMAGMVHCLADRELTSQIDLIGCESSKQHLTGLRTQVERYLVKKCVTLDTAHELVTCQDLLGQYAPLLPLLTLSDYKKFNLSAKCNGSCIEKFKATPDIPNAVIQSIMQDCFSSSNTVLDKSKIQQLGRMVTDLPVDKLKTISATDLVDSLNDIKQSFKTSDVKEMQSKKVVMREIAQKMKENGNIAMLLDSKELMKEVSLKDLKSSVTTAIIESASVVDLPIAQNRWVMKKIMDETPAEEFSASDLRNKTTLVKGMGSNDIRSLATEDRMDKAAALCEQTNWPIKSVKAINRDLIKGALLTLSDSTPMKELTHADVSRIGCECFMHFEPEELGEMIPAVCASVCQKVAKCENFRCLNIARRHKFTQACINCMDMTGSALVDALGPSLLPHLTVSQVHSLEDTAVTSSLQYMAGMCMPREFSDALVGRIMSVIGSSGATFTWDKLEVLKSAIMYLPLNILQQLDKNTVEQMANAIVAEVNPVDENAIRLQQCCEQWMSDSDIAYREQQKLNLFLTIKDAVFYVMRSLTELFRKRRSASGWTCDRVKQLQEAFTTVSNEDIHGMDDTEFRNCLSVIGQLTTWSSDQKIVLLDKTSFALAGDYCTMNNVHQLGVIAQAIAPTAMDCLDLSILDTVVSFGSLQGWNYNQLKSLADEYMTDNSLDNLSTITDEKISELGVIFCGFSPLNISSIPVAVVASTGGQIGRLSDCAVDQMAAVFALAKKAEAYGSVSNWTSAETSELKFIMAGMSKDDVTNLTADAFEGLSADVIPNILPDVLKEMSVQQLQNLSEAQRGAITTAQKAVMSDEQRDAVKLDQLKADVVDSLGTSVKAVVLVLLIALTASYI